ncbi:MAG: hypothetical protein K9K38_17235 [Rhodoferax sp.]|nr:hypothetical protein [Rhodoferax sp.]
MPKGPRSCRPLSSTSAVMPAMLPSVWAALCAVRQHGRHHRFISFDALSAQSVGTAEYRHAQASPGCR